MEILVKNSEDAHYLLCGCGHNLCLSLGGFVLFAQWPYCRVWNIVVEFHLYLFDICAGDWKDFDYLVTIMAIARGLFLLARSFHRRSRALWITFIQERQIRSDGIIWGVLLLMSVQVVRQVWTGHSESCWQHCQRVFVCNLLQSILSLICSTCRIMHIAV